MQDFCDVRIRIDSYCHNCARDSAFRSIFESYTVANAISSNCNKLPFKSHLMCACPDLVPIGWLLHQGYEIELWDVFERVVPSKFRESGASD